MSSLLNKYYVTRRAISQFGRLLAEYANLERSIQEVAALLVVLNDGDESLSKVSISCVYCVHFAFKFLLLPGCLNWDLGV